MKTYQLKFLAWTFSAFLPASQATGESEEVDYYELLGVARDANNDDIKKAYRKRSLELHPDKLRQRGMRYQGEVVTENEARVRFQQMKTAYDILSDEKKRQVYDALGHKGMDFVINPSHAYDPHVLLGNLAKSSVLDRGKLMILVLLFFGLALCQPILICAKVDQMLEENGGALEETSWAAILIPFWIFALAFGVVMVIGKALLPLLQWISLVVGVLFLALKFDGLLNWPYAATFFPFYFWMFFRGLEARKEMQEVKLSMSKMVTIEYIEKYILNEKKQDDDGNDIEEPLHRTYNDLTVEERDELNANYIIVHVPPKATPPGESDSIEHDLDQIESSLEYQEALVRHQEAYKRIQRIILPEIPLLILVIIQLDLNKDWNWGLTFIPLWIAIFMECCGGCYGFFCTATIAHIEVQESMAAHFANQSKEVKEEAKKSNDDGTKRDKCDEEGSVEVKNTDDSEKIVKSDTSETTDSVQVAPEPDLTQKDEIATAVTVNLEDDTKPSTNPETKDLEKGVVKTSGKSDLAQDDVQAENDESHHEEDEEYLRNVFSMDEDTFQYYQQAEQEAETKATEAQSKAIGSFCNVIFQLIIAILFVVKLNQVYKEKEDPEMEGTNSFSTFWILFPIFLFAGCTVCCCFCAIFCAADIDNAFSDEKSGGNQNVDDPVEEESIAVQKEEESLIPTTVESTPTSEGMELDVEGKAPKKDDVENTPNTTEESMHDLD